MLRFPRAGTRSGACSSGSRCCRALLLVTLGALGAALWASLRVESLWVLLRWGQRMLQLLVWSALC